VKVKEAPGGFFPLELSVLWRQSKFLEFTEDFVCMVIVVFIVFIAAKDQCDTLRRRRRRYTC